MTNVGRAFYCVTRAGDLVMFGRYHDHKVAQLQCPFGCIFADVKLMRHIIHAEVGIPSLEPMIRLKLADACARVAKNTTVRDSFQVAIRILEGKFNAEIDFPTGDEGSVEKLAKTFLNVVNQELFLINESAVDYVRTFYPTLDEGQILKIQTIVRKAIKNGLS